MGNTAIIKDFTTRKTIEDSGINFREILNDLPVAIYTCDADGLILNYNRAAVELWGREPELGMDMWCGSWKIFKTDGAPLPLDECPMAIALREGRVVNMEIVIEKPDGTRRHVCPHPQPIYDASGKINGAVNTLIDITEQKNIQHDLNESKEKFRLLADELEKHVEERTHELRNANEDLVKINHELEQFAFVASHDLQEPLRKIKTYTGLLEKTLKDDIGSRAYFKKINTSARRMENLITDVLNYSRLTHTNEKFIKVDLDTILENVLTDFELLVFDKQAIVTHDKLPVINGIPSQMCQLFTNLVSNSLKFTKDRPVINIGYELVNEQEAKNIKGLNAKRTYHKINFNDNGIGFEQQYAERIFTIFQRLNDMTSYNGTGIGLALCRKIVENHLGIITAQSELKKGSQFTIYLPKE